MDLDCYHVAAGLYRASVYEGAQSHAASSTKKQSKNPPKEKAKKESAGRRPWKQKAPKDKEKSRRSSGFLRDFWYFLCLRETAVYLTLLVPTYAFAQSFVGGDLSAQAPYGLPAQEFAAAAASSVASNNTFPITGYNTSLPAGTAGATESDVDGWSLNIRVLANVPLANTTRATINKNLYMDATVLTISPPPAVADFNSSAWRVCAIVFTGGLRAGGATHADGSCTGVLAEDCIDQLQANSLANGAGRTGGCRDLDVPTNCGVHFNGLTGTGYEITPIGNGSLADRGSMFFASGFEPAHRGNLSALAMAKRRVWPVLMAWTHFDETGAAADSASWMSCAKTNDSKEVADESPSSFAAVVCVPLGLEAVVWVVLVGVSMVFW